MSNPSGQGQACKSTETSIGRILLRACANVCMIARITTFKLACLCSRVVLEVLDVLLYMMQGVKRLCARWGTSKRARKSVCIIGGSFGGLSCARNLMDDFNVTVIDQRDFFEYTPGVLQLLVKPSMFKDLCFPLSLLEGVNFCHGTAVDVHDGSVDFLPHGSGEAQRVKFDFLILACGSNYSEGIKPDPREFGMQQREEGWRARAEEVAKASSVLVVGGGPVGVELAAEIVEKFPSKSVTLVDAHQSLCETFASSSSKRYMLEWLTRRNVRVLLGHRCIPQGSDGAVRTFLVGEETVRADRVYWCLGGRPMTGFLKDSKMRFTLKDDGSILVSDHLLVYNKSNIFAVGDAISIDGLPDEKLGHTAEIQAKLVCNNIRSSLTGSRMHHYIPSLESRMYCLSLGKYSGSVRLGHFTLNGFVAALLKWGIEWTKVAQARGRPVGRVLWRLSDALTSRTVDHHKTRPPPPSHTSMRIR